MATLEISTYIKEAFVATLHMLCGDGDWAVRVWLNGEHHQDFPIDPPALTEVGIVFIETPDVVVRNITGDVELKIVKGDTAILELIGDCTLNGGDFTCTFDPLNMVTPG